MHAKLFLHAGRVAKNYLFYRSSQQWNRNRIERYQDEQLKSIITHAAEHVPYYRNLFNEIGFDAGKFSGRSDMHLIPLLDKETLRTRGREFIADNAHRYGIHWDSTSGSTGTPLSFIVDNSIKSHKLACVLRSYQWGGYSPGRRTFSIQSYEFKSSRDLFKHYTIANLWRIDAKKFKKDTMKSVVDLLHRQKPAILIGYPFSIFMLAKYAADENIAIGQLKAIITAGETLSRPRRKLLEDFYQCKVIDFYSHHENVSIISECECQQKHICEDFAYNEIVSDNGAKSQSSGVGDLIGTGFYNYAMPLIRYKIGDRVELGDSTKPCPCGRSLKTVNEIIGRQNDYIVTPEGLMIGNVLEHAVDHSKGIILSQCVQDAVDHIYVNMIVDNKFSDASLSNLEKGLRERLGSLIKIDFKIVTDLEKSKSGKTPFIMSKIGHTYF